ncbi:MAG: heme A synthase [Candidatus Bipolaricaulia bacterium]
MTASKRLKRLVMTATVSTYLLLILGGVVSSTGAGLACPDWPLCHGQLIPPLEGPVLIEYSHRLVALVAGLSILAMVVAAWRHARRRPITLVLSNLAVFLFLAQAGLGGITVLYELPTEAATAHLGVGTGLFVVLVTLTALIVLAEPFDTSAGLDRNRSRSNLCGWVIGAAIVVFAQMVLGAYVRHSGASLACPDFPRCLGQWVPPLTGSVLVHFAHRLGAIASGVVVIGVCARVWWTVRKPRSVVVAAVMALGLVAVQIALGVIVVVSQIDLGPAIAHLAVAELLLATLIFLGVRTGARETIPAPVAPALLRHEQREEAV